MNKKEALEQLREHLSTAPIELKEYVLKSWEEQASEEGKNDWFFSEYFYWEGSREGLEFWNVISKGNWQEALDLISQPAYDHINPSHYKQSGREVIDMMVDIWGKKAVAVHCEITAFKYRMRLGNKPDQPIERDLEKAKWYEAKAKELKTDKQ